MPNTTVYAAVAALLGALIALAIYHVAAVRPALAEMRRLLGLHEDLLGDGRTAASERLLGLERGLGDARSLLERVTGRIDELEALAATDVSRIGFVRYDAFEDTGSDLSYALALLNRAGDGVVISSIYSRTDTRTYGKAVKSFKPAANASEEELRAIELARTSVSNA
ncbi:MAG: DUF4446 family protein [Candidatus Eremiobacteraeota bacterium]|nr:DUF4446 family protein [Candidatus Eremiobacteraeota bacterium]MBV8433129.1 DUF4446 family protein [Candidatus Eremiobacteraeota bacterium]MBV8583274.1 DUF4446 family protein [Candidatus Eremiobacteraeota bacterium]MBV8655713.1 DUF4446 family protein [Candidatus Eremiobacteraeota bacterium]MBV8721470.1 DUF4446 family protein [Candidatus Eremiobacteraeota bacterium]